MSKASGVASNHRPIVFDADRESDSPLVERVWTSHSEFAGSFTSVSASHCEIVFSNVQGRRCVTLRGPETTPSRAWCPRDGQFLGIRFRLGTVLSGLAPHGMMNRQDITLPVAGGRYFSIDGSRFEIPSMENAESFVADMLSSGLIRNDEVVRTVLNGDVGDFSARTQQRRFALATGLTIGTVRQIERARSVALLLSSGTSIGDAVEEAGYYDHAHLARSVRRFIGVAPSLLAGGTHPQLSLLYKTTSA